MATNADLKMELAISRMLRAGVGLSAVMVLIGALLYLVRAHGVKPDYHHFHGISGPANHIVTLIAGIRRFDSSSIIRLGIVLLIATPVLRVAYCVFGFAAQKDKLYVAISGVVLATLVYSFFRR